MKNKRESVETNTQNTQKSDDIVRSISKDIEPDRNVLVVPKKRKAWNKGLKIGNTRSIEGERQRIENRRKNGWWKNPSLTKSKIGNSNIIALKEYYKTNDVWNKNLTKEDPRVFAYVKHTAGILKNKEKYKEPIERIRQYQISHPNRKFSGTNIEIAIKDALLSKGLKEGIDFIGQVPVMDKNNKKYFCRDDWYLIKKDLHIFCDGCHWHGCDICNEKGTDGMRERDKRANDRMNANSIKYIRFMEHDILNRIDWCIKKLGI
jgi:G:T-mismatch repair DNA endonuclease (very short patch repair protein)